jgi:hypothetical protein
MQSHISICSYPSLRTKAICVFVLGFCVSCFYFLPYLLVNQFGFNYYVNGIFLALFDIINCPLISLNIIYFRRKPVLYATSAAIFLSSFALIFFNQGKICTFNCWNIALVTEFVLFLLLIFSGGLLMGVLLIYVSEMFPVQVAALGLGIGHLALCLANIIMPSILIMLTNINFPIMVIFCLLVIVFVLALLPLPETLGK